VRDCNVDSDSLLRHNVPKKRKIDNDSDGKGKMIEKITGDENYMNKLLQKRFIQHLCSIELSV
jgi:hypothetical protein